MPANGDFVTYGRWEEAHNDLKRRVELLEGVRVDEAVAGKARRAQVWTLVLTVAGGVMVSLLSTSLIAWLHIHGGS